MNEDRVPYDAEHAIVRDFGRFEVVAVWTADTALAEQLRVAGMDVFDQLTLNPRNEIEAVARLSRTYKADGYEVSGWHLSSAEGGWRADYVASNKREALKEFRAAIIDYFTPSRRSS